MRRSREFLVGRVGLFGLFFVALTFSASSSAKAQQLTLEEAWLRFLEHSPLVAAEKETMEMARGRLAQTQVWSNPVLNYGQEGYPVGRPDSTYDDQEFLLTAWQEFELGGKRGKRRNLAQLELDAESARYADFLRRRRLEISKLYAGAYYASRRQQMLERVFVEYSRIRDAHRKRYELGEVSGLSQLKIEAEELWYLVEQARAERELNSSWSELAAWIAWEDSAVPTFVLQDSAGIPIPDLETLIRRALELRPDLRSRRLDSQAAEAAVELEKSRKTPNLNLGGGYKRDFGTDSFFVGVQFPLPLWDRREGAVEEKLASSRRQANLSLWTESWIRREVERTYSVFSRLLVACRRLDSTVARKLERAVEVTALSYQEGEAGILEYLDALRTQRDAMLEHNHLLAELSYAQLELEAAVGLRLGEITP